MKQLKVILLAFLAISLSGVARAEATWDYLMKPKAAAAAMERENARIVDIRSFNLGFSRGHLPGSVSIPFWRFRGEAGASGVPPSADALTELVRAAGLTQADRVLIVHSGLNEKSFAAASWVYWVMKSSGFANLSILDGGVRGWRMAGLPITKRAIDFPRSDAVVEFSDRWLATTEDVARITKGDRAGTLLDSRADDVKSSRTIAGAMTYALTRLMEPSRKEALGPVDMLDKLKNVDVAWENEAVITFCNDGLQGAATWFMASEVVGISDVKLYAESLQGWAKQATN